VSAAESPKKDAFKERLVQRQARGRLWSRLFFASNAFALLTLILLALTIINGAFGYVAVQFRVDPDTLSDRPLETLSEAELGDVLVANAAGRMRVIIRDNFSQVPNDVFTTTPLPAALNVFIPTAWQTLTINELNEEQLLSIITNNLSQEQMYDVVLNNIVQPNVVASWQFFYSLFNRAAIEAEMASEYPAAELIFRSWVTPRFISSPLATEAADTGLRTALLGTLWVIAICVLFSFPLGVGAAIYLEEYADDSFINRLIETNIRNLAGVPSIIYGLLGLTVFVRFLVTITSGQFVGVQSDTGRTILSAGLTLGLLILPVIIINAQEAIRAVPYSIREASYGLGATKWQTTWRQVLPAALPGILTGFILALSRAIGETAPLIVIGGASFISFDPSGPFSRFTVVPLQIYNWTKVPDIEFRNVAAAAIIVLMSLLLIMNSAAIILRNRFSKKLAG
jgi:phosphate transport system permease protein